MPLEVGVGVGVGVGEGVGVGVGVELVTEFPPPMGLTSVGWAVIGRALSQLVSVAPVHSAVVAVVVGFTELPEE